MSPVLPSVSLQTILFISICIVISNIQSIQRVHVAFMGTCVLMMLVFLGVTAGFNVPAIFSVGLPFYEKTFLPRNTEQTEIFMFPVRKRSEFRSEPFREREKSSEFSFGPFRKEKI
jgi:hypothetical protein